MTNVLDFFFGSSHSMISVSHFLFVINNFSLIFLLFWINGNILFIQKFRYLGSSHKKRRLHYEVATNQSHVYHRGYIMVRFHLIAKTKIVPT